MANGRVRGRVAWEAWFRRISAALLAVACALLSAGASGTRSETPPPRASMPAAQKTRVGAQASERRKLAEGEYAIVTRMNEGGFGPFNPMVYDFRETWTLWGRPDGGYEVEGERTYESPKYERRRERFRVELTRNWALVRIADNARLRWRPDAGPLACEFEVAALHCASKSKAPGQAVKLDLTFDHPFGFLWPISAFSLASIAKAVERTPGEATPVQVITVEEPGPSNPIYPLVLTGNLQYRGSAETELAGRRWEANEFDLEVPFHPKFRLLTAPEGFLLDLMVPGPRGEKPIAELKLTRYRQFASPAAGLER
ncbi:MAG TPA: hypothetical protein VGS20_10995 [Candidatus Acidoferrales bacterium]|nr:hypothetical protein [Candidatus Acidoferrales bacterium]